MKTIIRKLLFTLILCLMAHSAILAQKPINISVKNISIKELFSDIQKNTAIRLYTATVIWTTSKK